MPDKLDLTQAFTDPSTLGTIPPAERPVEEPAPQQTEPVTQESVTPPSVEPKPAGFDLSTFNQWLKSNEFDYQIENEDQLKKVIGSLNEIEEIEKKAQEYTAKEPYFNELETALQEMVSVNDPVTRFGSLENFKAHLIAQKLAENKPVDNPKYVSVINTLSQVDISKLNDLDLVSLGWQYDSPKFAGEEFEIRKAILKKAGVDEELFSDPSFKLSDVQLTPEQELNLSRMAKSERDRFDSVRGGVVVPDQKDWKSIIQERVEKRKNEIQAAQTRIEQVKTGWEGEAKRAAETIKSIDFTLPNEKGENVVEFSYDVDSEFKKLVPDMVTDYALQHNLDPTPENIQAVLGLVKGVYQLRNMERMMQAYKKDLESKLREQYGRETHNGRPINTGGPPPDRSKLTESDYVNIVAEQILKR